MTTALSEWLTPASVSYLAECLQHCQDSGMLADLRAIAPPQALKEASKRLSPAKRQQIKAWVERLNSEMGVAA
jgi:hypothetical protein